MVLSSHGLLYIYMYIYYSNNYNISPVDDNECIFTDVHGCSHTCRNTMGGYECLCPTGLILNTDKKTCVGE